MRVLAGLDFGGATLTEFDDLEPAQGRLGHVVWNPSQLLRDLELRLGLGVEIESEALRSPRFGARMAELAPRGRFYSKSFEIDALATARAVLRLRDSLVEAGWGGQELPEGGARLEGITELENLGGPELPPGYVDRLATAERSLADWQTCLYSEIVLAEPERLWPSRWRAIFRSFERLGTALKYQKPSFPGASANTDLGRVQGALEAGNSTTPIALEGDGSLVLLTAETSWEAASAVVAILDNLAATRTVVVREGDVSALDNIFSGHGARTQGWRSTSPWRAALQVMPLALELAFEPKDPQRVLELLTLPVGPFLGFTGRRLAEALAQSPGIGSPSWEEAKVRLAKGAAQYDESARGDRGAQLLARIADWLERPGDDAVSGAPKTTLLEVLDRVRAWLISRIPTAPEDAMLLTAAGHARTLRAALETDPRSTLTLVEVRRLAESVLESGAEMPLINEAAGRIAHVGRPGNIRVARENVLWWSFVASPRTHAGLAWRRQELAALLRAGVSFPNPKMRLADRALGWRQAVLSATERLILVVPQQSASEKTAPHPLWDELVAVTRADEATLARITLNARELRTPSPSTTLLRRPSLRALAPIALPGGYAQWRVPIGAVAPIDHFSAASLNALLGCPLQWGLQYRAGVNSGGHALPPLVMLNGSLGHRLVEVLFAQAAFELPLAALRERAEAELDQLFKREGSILLRAGMAFERAQLRKQLVDSMLELSRSLSTARLRILAVEKSIDIAWRGGKMVGRIDLLVENPEGIQAIIDVKWGYSGYRDLLQSGHALQLAVYAFAHGAERNAQTIPEATYFSLKQQKLFGLRSKLLPNAEELGGPSLAATWQKIERSVEKAEVMVASGRFPVTGVRQSLPLLHSLAIPEGAHGNHFGLPAKASCEYCAFDAICGRRWELSQ
jgi:ATP-dependent helicase/nuclease subunit B